MSSTQPAEYSNEDDVPFNARQLETIRNIFKAVLEESGQSSSKGRKPDQPEGSKRGRSPRRTPSEERRRDPKRSSRERERSRSESRPRRRDSSRPTRPQRSRSRPSRRDRRRDPDLPYDSDASAEGAGERRGGEDNRFRPEEIGYFNPYLEVSSSAPAGDITNIGDKTFYRNVHLFVDAFKDVASTKSSGLVRRNLNKCLRGGAQDWWIGTLSDVEREYVREGHGLERWERFLFRRFKRTQSSALKALEEDHYTIDDARQGRETAQFVSAVVRNAKDAGISTTSAQLTFAWNKIHPDLRGYIRRPSERTTMTDFIDELEDMKEVWHDKYARRHEPSRALTSQPQRRQQGNNDRRFPPRQSPGQFPAAGYGAARQPFPFQQYPQQFQQGYAYNNQQPRNQQNVQQPTLQLPARLPLQITAGNIGSSGQKNDQRNPPAGPTDRRNGQWNGGQGNRQGWQN